MCSRYYIDQTMAQELEILFGRLAGRSRQGAGFRPERIRSGDVRPTDTAPVLAEGDGSPVLFMAGLCRQYEDGAHFVILTTEANASMKPVHDRMPLILDPDDVVPWLLDQGTARTLLQKTPCLLERRTDYEQLSLFTDHYR